MRGLLSKIACRRVSSLLGFTLLVAALAMALIAPTSRSYVTFYQGDRVQVTGTGGVGLNVRSYAGLGYTVVSKLYEGQTVTVVSGPIWNNGYAWYRVTGYDRYGNTGWSAGAWLYRVARGGGTYTNTAASTRSTTTASTRSYTSSGYRGATYTVSATGYNGAEFGSAGYMANGQRVYWGAVAVDPRYIPLGTRMYISGFGNQVFVASDTGSAIKGWKIDIWFPSVSQALAFGRQTRTVTIIR